MKTIESGRSMIEMLGVLAIIGVLSIGGIAGYTMAMNKFRANEIVNAVVQAAVECRTRGGVSEEIYTDIQGLGAISCVRQSFGIVSFTMANPEVAKVVVKTIDVYSTASTTDTDGVDTSTKLTSSSSDTDLKSTAYYQPTT